MAAWLVFCHHYPYGPPPPTGWPRLAHYSLLELHGLPLLLLLSGFLIALRYDDGSSGFRPSGGWPAYLQTRLARIYPLFALLTLLTFAWLWRWNSPHATLGILLLNLSLLRGFFDEYKFSGIGQAWSLTLLECLYLAAPVLFGLRRRGLPLWVQPLLLLVVGVGLVRVLAPLRWHGLFGSYGFMLQFTFLGHSLEFFVGVWLAGRYRRGLLASGAGSWLTFSSVLLLLFITAALAFLQAGLPLTPISEPLILILNLLALPLAGGLLFAGLMKEDTFFRKLLSHRWFQILGRSSYAFYLLHAGPLSFWVYERLPASFLLRLLAVQLVSYLAYRFVEEPLTQWLRPRPVSARSALLSPDAPR